MEVKFDGDGAVCGRGEGWGGIDMLTTNENTRPMANSSLLVPFITPIAVVKPMTCRHRSRDIEICP